MALRNTAVPDEIKILLRIGVNIGDVVIEDDDIHGDGVNVAARLEGLCGPGEVYVSGAAHDQAVGKLSASFEDLGEHTVKNITKPVRVYLVNVEPEINAGPTLQSTETSSSVRDKPSIAVLPFDNLSNDPEQEYFSDGMAEDLITDISKISGVSIAARNSSFVFKGQAIDVKDIAKRLGVKHIVEGSVRKMGDRLRINAQLIDAVSGRHIWADRYDGKMAEIFDFQDDIREQIVTALQINLSPSDKVLTERKSTDNATAYDLFLKGRANFYNFSRENLPKAIEFLEAATKADPNIADAYGYLSYCHFSGWVSMFPGFENHLSRARELAEKAVTLDDTSGLARARLGFIQMWLRQYEQAILNLENALVLDPDNAEVCATFGAVMNYCGDPERGLQMLERAFSLETFSPPVWDLQAGLSHFLLRQYDEAMEKLNQAVERAPMLMHAHLILASSYVELDQLDGARDEIEKLVEIIPSFSLKEADRIFPYRLDDVKRRVLATLRKAELPEE
jgi:adenylate cyclase